jgi:hypothetical protein
MLEITNQLAERHRSLPHAGPLLATPRQPAGAKARKPAGANSNYYFELGLQRGQLLGLVQRLIQRLKLKHDHYVLHLKHAAIHLFGVESESNRYISMVLSETGKN